MTKALVLTLAVLLTPRFGLPQDDVVETRRLIRQVALSGRHIVFSYAGDLWRVEASGGSAEQLTRGPEEDEYPVVSRDGLWIAFSRRWGADWDVHMLPSGGGEARRLTYNPAADIARGWTPDGQRILFMSHRDEEGIFRLYTIDNDGSFPTPLPLPRGTEGSYSSDGKRIAYVPYSIPLDRWRYYRGGMAAPIWIANLGDSSIKRLPREDSNDRFPMWVGDTIYFVSDRSGTQNLHRYINATGAVEQITSYARYGITHAAESGGRIVFVQDGVIRLFDTTTGVVDSIAIEINPDTSELVTRTVSIAPYIQSASISTIGDKVVFEARGEIIIYDRLSGQSQNLTQSPGVAERNPSFSPDGQWLGYFSDDSGDYHAQLRNADGSGDVLRTGQIELRPTFYRDIRWSPDATHVSFTDKRLSLWISDMETGGARRAATSTYSNQGSYQVSWSPNGSIMAYSEAGENRNRIIYMYDVNRGRKRQVTGPEVSAEYPVFDKSGKYLFLLSSSDAALDEFGCCALSGAMNRPLVTSTLQVVVLRNDIPAPVFAATGEPNLEALADSGIGRALIHTDGIRRRIVPLPLPPRDYAGLAAGKPGELYVLTNEWPDSPALGSAPTQNLYRYRLSNPKRLELFLRDIDHFEVSTDGSAILYQRGEDWAVVPTSEPPEEDSGRLNLDSVTVEIDPLEEWRQIYREAWRLMRDYFYDPGHHGQDIHQLEGHYATYLPSVTRREDLNNLLRLALGHVSVSNLVVSGGDTPAAGSPQRVGLLGADYEISEGRYRIKRIYRSGHYNSPNRLLRAPLDQPGVDVQEGDYLLAVDGVDVVATRNIYSYFEGKAFKPVEITVGLEPARRGTRTYTIVPISSENALRRANWALANQRLVDEMTQGQIRYMYVPNYTDGLEPFFREVLSNPSSKGFVIDERFASGGITADYLIELLSRVPLYYYIFRHGDDLAIPTNPTPAAKVLLINNVTASDAETFALMFKLGKLGRTVGTRTFGAGVSGDGWIPRLIDGGRVSIPSRAAFNPDNGTWTIENEGVAANIEVEWLPEDWRAGVDPQLDAAVKAVLRFIVDNVDNVKQKKKPDYPKLPTGSRTGTR